MVLASAIVWPSIGPLRTPKASEVIPGVLLGGGTAGRLDADGEEGREIEAVTGSQEVRSQEVFLSGS